MGGLCLLLFVVVVVVLNDSRLKEHFRPCLAVLPVVRFSSNGGGLGRSPHRARERALDLLDRFFVLVVVPYFDFFVPRISVRAIEVLFSVRLGREPPEKKISERVQRQTRSPVSQMKIFLGPFVPNLFEGRHQTAPFFVCLVRENIKERVGPFVPRDGVVLVLRQANFVRSTFGPSSSRGASVNCLEPTDVNEIRVQVVVPGMSPLWRTAQETFTDHPVRNVVVLKYVVNVACNLVHCWRSRAWYFSRTLSDIYLKAKKTFYLLRAMDRSQCTAEDVVGEAQGEKPRGRAGSPPLRRRSRCRPWPPRNVRLVLGQAPRASAMVAFKARMAWPSATLFGARGAGRCGGQRRERRTSRKAAPSQSPGARPALVLGKELGGRVRASVDVGPGKGRALLSTRAVAAACTGPQGPGRRRLPVPRTEATVEASVPA